MISCTLPYVAVCFFSPTVTVHYRVPVYEQQETKKKKQVVANSTQVFLRVKNLEQYYSVFF